MHVIYCLLGHMYVHVVGIYCVSILLCVWRGPGQPTYLTVCRPRKQDPASSLGPAQCRLRARKPEEEDMDTYMLAYACKHRICSNRHRTPFSGRPRIDAALGEE